MRQPTLSINRVWLLVMLGLVAYLLPWIANTGAALTANAYDLAEWASLTPAGRAALPLYLPTLFLRLPLVIFAWMLAVNVPRRVRSRAWLAGTVAVVILAVALLPPFEFFIRDRSDPNYLQQFALATAALVIGLGLLSRRAYTVRGWITGSLALVGMVTAIIGLLGVQALMQQYRLPAGIGAGGAVLVLVYGVIIYLLLNQVWENKQGSRNSTLPHDNAIRVQYENHDPKPSS